MAACGDENSVSVELNACLKKYWGYSSFLEGQLDICLNVLRNKDSFVIMATGSGKSLTFQLPAVYLRERGIRATTIVVSPLISLIDDQVSSLLAMGIPSCAVGSNSSLDIENRAMRGEFYVVYATPEKVMTWHHGLRELSAVAHIACFAVDESHCVSEWGHDFRPDYRRLGELRDVLDPKIPWVGLTASATVAVQADIVRNLRLRQPLVAKASLNRKNLKYCVLNRTGPNDLLRLINEYRKEQLLAYPTSIDKASVPFYPTLIYVNSKKETEDLAKLLVECRLLNGIKVAFYHAGMQPLDRSAVHMAFSKDEIQVVIATVAFGMGINKPDVRMVIHYGMPKSVESYYQQTGRGGRDGLPARCVLLFSRQDVVRCFNIASFGTVSLQLQQQQQQQQQQIGNYQTGINGSGGNDFSSNSGGNRGGGGEQSDAWTAEQMEQRSASDRLAHQINCMKEYCTSGGRQRCRRRYLMHYFGEEMQPAASTGVEDECGPSSLQMISPGLNCCDLCDERIKFAPTALPEHSVNQNNNNINNNSNNSGTTLTGINNPVGDAIDLSKEVFMLLSTIISCGEVYGINVPLGILLGKHDKSVQRVHEYSSLAYFGCGTLHSTDWWKELVHQLVEVDYYVEAVLTKLSSGFSYQRYIVTQAGRRFLNPLSMSVSSYHPYYEAADNNARGGVDSYVPGVHIYRTTPTRDLQRYLDVETNKRRPPPPVQQQCSAGYGSSTLGRSKSTGNSTSIAALPGNPMFRFVPEDMAFDPATVAQYVHSGRNGAVQDFGEYQLEQERIKICTELNTLLERQLRQTRNNIAQSSGLNPYNVLTTADISELLKAAPTSLAELAKLPGWGDWKLKNFGEAFVEAVVNFKSSNASQYTLLEAAAVKSRELTERESRTGGLLLNASTAGVVHAPATAATVPVRPVVRLYRPNYDAASRTEKVLSSASEVEPTRTACTTLANGCGTGNTGGSGSSCNRSNINYHHINLSSTSAALSSDLPVGPNSESVKQTSGVNQSSLGERGLNIFDGSSVVGNDSIEAACAGSEIAPNSEYSQQQSQGAVQARDGADAMISVAAPAPSVASAFSVAAKKRQIANTGLAAFKAKFSRTSTH